MIEFDWPEGFSEKDKKEATKDMAKKIAKGLEPLTPTGKDRINEACSKICDCLLNGIFPDLEGKEFVDASLLSLTFCIKGIIEASFCKSHYREAYAEVIEQITQDYADLEKGSK